MADYFFLINENENNREYVSNERWWIGGDSFAQVLGKNGRVPFVKGYGDYYFKMGYGKYTLTQKECHEIGEILKEKFGAMKYSHKDQMKTDPSFAHEVNLAYSISERLLNATEDDKFIAYWQ